MSKLLEYMQNANHPADVYIEKASDDSSADDSSSSEGSGFLSGLRNFLEHPFQGSGTVIAPNYTPRPLDDSVYSDIPGTPVASGQFGDIEDESVRDERMKESADYMAANWPRLYGGVVAADEGLANVVGGIQNAVGGGNGILTNVQRAEEGMQNYRDQWNNEYGDSYFLNPNKFATDAGSGIGSTVPIMALSALMPGAAVAGGTRALTSALSRAGLGRLAMSKAGQALIADTVRSPISSLADSLSEYGTVVNDMMQNGMSEDEARRRAIPMFFKNMALDTFTVPLELGVMKGGKGIATSLLGRSAGEGMAKSIAKGAARTGMLAGASGLTEGYQEGAQNALENDVEGNRDGGWYNPFTWTNEDWEAARGGFVGGALMGVPGNVAAGFHPEARQSPLSAESQEQAQSIKDTLSHGKPAGMSNAAYNAYIELANSGNPDLIKQAASSLESFQQSQEGSQESTDDAATEAYKDYETYDQKQEIENFLNNNTVEQIGGEKNFNWLMGVLRNGTPEEVQHAYDTVIAAEKATAEQEAKNRPARSGGSMAPNTGNAMVNIVIQAANDSGVDPRLGLAIAARESGGDDVNAISMPPPHDGVYGVMQAQEETVSNMGLDSQYPDWKTDPYQNAMVGMAILKAKIDGENGDVWAGVRDYDGAGEEAEQYRQLVKNNYDNMGDIGGGGGSATYDGLQLTLPDSDEFTDQSGNVSGLTEDTRMKLRVLDNLCYQKFGQHLIVSSSYREGDPNNHGAGVAFDVSGGIVDDPDARQWLEQAGPAVGLFVIPEYQGEAGAEFAHGDNVHFSNVEPGIYGQTRNAEGHWSEEHAAPSIQSILKGGASGGVSGKVTGDNGQFERELDQAAQEAKSDMDKIQAQSDQAMNEIMNDDSAEKTAQDAQQDAENAQKQAEESQQSAQDDVVPDVAQTIRDTSNDIDEINTLDGMFTKDSNGNDKFIDTPENRDFIKANYKDEITKAVNDAMSKKKAPSATPAPKTQQQTPHARLGRILSTYDRKDPKFKKYMNTFRNGTEQEQKKLADDLQTTQELERANSLKGNPLTTQQDQSAPQNAPQQTVETPKHPEQVNTPVQAKESLETQKKRKIYLAKKQKLMERVPAGKTVKVHASTNDAGFDATYKIVPAGDITASHDMNYAVNDLYPAEYQPRDRNRPQMRGQVEKMTKGMKPELLAESQFVNEGAPVVNNSGVVLNGNGRVMAVQKAYKGLTDAHKKSAKAYKDYLVSIAPSLGIAPEKVQSMDHPVLVRQAADDADTNAIINSTEGGAKLGGAEQAKADADRLKLSTLEQFVDNGTGEFMNPSNREFRRAAASDVFSDAEGNSVFNEKGDLSPTGAFRIRNAIFAKAYNDNYLLTQLSEATDNNSKNIMNAMIAAAPEVAKVNEGIKNGTLYPDYDISDVITKTAKTIMSLRNEGKPLSFHLQETDLFSQGESEAERLVLEFIERNKFKSRTIADMYKGACDRIFAVGSPKQSKLFDSKEAPRISLENIISNAIQEVEHGQSLFDTTEEKPAEKTVSEVPDNRQAEPAGSGRVHQQEAGRVQSQEKEGNEVDEKSKQSDHVDAEPQQTESKDKESTHAEEGSQGDVQEEVSKFHNVLDDEKSTPKQVIDAYKSIVDKVIASANGSRKNAKIGDKIVTEEYQSLTNSKHWGAFMNEDGGRNWHEVATINADAHKTLRAIIKTAGKETAPKAEQSKETKPAEQPKEKAGFTDDEIKTLTDRGFNRWTKKLSNGKVMDRLYIKPEYLGLELTRYKSGNISSAKFNGEAISNSEARRIEGTKCYVDVATKEVVCDREDLKQAAQEVVDDALSKEKFQEAEKGKKYSVREANDKLTRSKEDLKAEIKEAFPNAKEIKDEGDRMTFTMPNGSHIVVDVKNEILLTDDELAQAKKDHHIDDNGNVVVEGYAQLHGKDAYMALSQGSRENTGFHEAYHLAEGAVLTDREKAAIKKAIPDAEKRADKYAEWVEARKHGRGTAWGKLFQKIKDFAAKMRKIFTGVETVNDIFRQIESGKVWERGANNSNQRGSYSVYAKRKLKEDMQTFAKKIDDFMNHKLSSNEYVRVMDTPLVFDLVGEKHLPIYISPNVLNKILNGKHHSEISSEMLKEIPRRLADPMFILRAINHRTGVEDTSSKIIVIDLKDKNGATIMIPFVMEQQTKDDKKIMSNLIKSVYGRTTDRKTFTPNDAWYVDKLKKGDALYVNKKRTDHWLTGINTSARTHSGPLVVDSFNLSTIIADENDLGKLKKDNPSRYSIREQDQKINTDAKKRFMNHIEVAQKQADENAIGVHRTLLQSPSRIAEKKKYFKPFFKMADDAMNLLTKLRADYQRHLDSALDLSKKDKAALQELLWSGDMEGKEYTREELREQGYNEQVIDSYWKIRNLFRKAYNQLNETRKQAKTKTGHFAGRKLDELRNNKFVEILRETNQDDGSTLVSYKEYGNWQAHYLVNEDELKTLENDDNIQILEKVPTKEGPMDGQKHWKVTTREGVPDIHDRKGYVPHFFHEYMVRFVDSHGKATVISSGRTIREATKNAIKWQAENEEMLKKRNKGDWKITIAPKVFDFGEIGLDESQYATTVGDKDFYRMEKKIADKHSLTLHEAKEMLDGMVKKKGRHRFFGNFLRRTGADGYEQEIEWVLRHYFNSTSRYVAMESKFKPQAISLFERLFGRFDNEYHGLPNYIKEYINDINGNPSTLEKQLNDLLNAIPAIGKWVNAHVGDRAAVSLANSITNKISIAKLGFLNVSSAMLNILQIANAAAYTGNISTLWKALLKGAHRKYSLHDLKILRETNVLNDIGLDSGAGYGKFSAGKWANRGMILFKESEGIVRRGVTLAAYEAGRKRGMSHEEAIRYAKDVNRKSNFDYGVHDAPGIFRRGSIFSQIFLQFKKYPIKQLEAMKDFLPFFGKGTTKKQKAIFWGTYFAMAGLFQIPFANILGLLIMGITGDDPEKEAKNSLIELAENYPSLKPLAKIGMYGIGTFANIDITSRVGIGDAVPDDLQSLFGPAASTLFNVAKSAYGGDNWTKQVRNISPGLGNLLMAAQGNSVGKRGRVNQEYTTPYQRLLRGMGFQSTDESDSYLIQSILSSEKKKASSKKQQLIDEYIANPTGENARKLKSAGIKPSTVKAEQKKKKLDTQGRTESSMNKNDKKQYKYLLDW